MKTNKTPFAIEVILLATMVGGCATTANPVGPTRVAWQSKDDMVIVANRSRFDVYERSQASMRLTDVNDPSLTPKLIELLLNEPVPGIAGDLATAVARQINGPSIALLVLKSGKLSAVQRSRLASGYVSVESGPAADLLVLSYHDPSALVRRKAIESMFGARNTELQKIKITAAQKDLDPDVRHRAAQLAHQKGGHRAQN